MTMTMTMTKYTYRLLVGAVAATQLGATDCGEILSDPGFDLWCGEQLCSWELERGTIDQVPTWHEGDDGVELLGRDTAISQLTAVNYLDGSCIEFELIADVDPGVDLHFLADVYGDGTIEVDEPIPAADWQPLTYRFDIAGEYEGVKFWIAKGSEGHAVVAQLAARICSNGRTATTTVSSKPAPLGARCDDCPAVDDLAHGTCATVGVLGGTCE